MDKKEEQTEEDRVPETWHQIAVGNISVAGSSNIDILYSAFLDLIARKEVKELIKFQEEDAKKKSLGYV